MIADNIQYLTPEQAATRLQMHVDSVKKLMRERRIPGRKIGGRWRIHPDHLDAFVRGETPATKPSTSDAA